MGSIFLTFVLGVVALFAAWYIVIPLLFIALAVVFKLLLTAVIGLITVYAVYRLIKLLRSK